MKTPGAARQVGPRIVIDARCVGNTLHGMARYTLLLAQGLAQRSLSYQPVFLVQPGQADKFAPFETREVAIPFLSPLESFKIPGILRELRADLYHSPTFSSLAYCPCPWLVTIHDLNHLTYGGLKEKIYYQLLLKRFARSARQVLTVSKFSRHEMSSWLGLAEEKIGIVYNAIDASLGEPLANVDVDRVLQKFSLERGGYFFCLSNPKPHKNVALLVEAFEKFRQNNAQIPLVLSMREFSDHSGVKSLGGCSEEETRALLSGAKALFFPSLYEGFGLPPVEAAASGITVVVSDIAPHREALQDLSASDALWVTPHQVAPWTEAMNRCSRGELGPIPQEVRQAILTRYSVPRLAAEMDAIYASNVIQLGDK